jgi:hypothetical protein
MVQHNVLLCDDYEKPPSENDWGFFLLAPATEQRLIVCCDAPFRVLIASRHFSGAQRAGRTHKEHDVVNAVVRRFLCVPF